MTASDDDFDLADLVRRAAARHGKVQVVDFADLGQLSPQMRRAGHLMAKVIGAMDLVTSFHEIATRHLAQNIAQALERAGGADGDGAVDIEIDTAAGAAASDPELLTLWENAQPGARRDLVASLAQLLALTRRRRGVDGRHVAAMIGEHAGPGQLWMLAERQLDDAVTAGRDWEAEAMLPDGPHLPALTSSPGPWPPRTSSPAARSTASTSGWAPRCCWPWPPSLRRTPPAAGPSSSPCWIEV
jgi:hypothetical protein